MAFVFGKASLDHMAGIDHRLVELAHRALSITKIDFGIPSTGGLRSAETQNQLFLAGKSEKDGYENLSKHQYGSALDFYAYVDDHASWDQYYMTQVAAAFLQASVQLGYKVQWGGLWKNFVDLPHIQLME